MRLKKSLCGHDFCYSNKLPADFRKNRGYVDKFADALKKLLYSEQDQELPRHQGSHVINDNFPRFMRRNENLFAEKCNTNY